MTRLLVIDETQSSFVQLFPTDQVALSLNPGRAGVLRHDWNERFKRGARFCSEEEVLAGVLGLLDDVSDVLAGRRASLETCLTFWQKTSWHDLVDEVFCIRLTGSLTDEDVAVMVSEERQSIVADQNAMLSSRQAIVSWKNLMTNLAELLCSRTVQDPRFDAYRRRSFFVSEVAAIRERRTGPRPPRGENALE